MREIIGPRRVAALRAFPGFAALSVDDISALSAVADEQTYRRGSSLARAGAAPGQVLFVLDGDVRVRRPGGERMARARDVVGLYELLAGDPDGVDAIAESDTRALVVSHAALLEFLDDSFAALLEALRAMSRDLVTRLSHRLGLSAIPGPPRTPPRFAARRPLGYAERLLVLHSALMHAPRRVEATAELARVAVWEHHPAGTMLWRVGNPSGSAIVIVAGEIVATPAEGRPVRLGPGNAMGALEALSGVARWFHAEAATDLALLRIACGDVIDVFEDHSDLGLDVLRTMATVLLRLERLS